MTIVSGIGWIEGGACGCAGTGEQFRFGGDEKALFAHPFRNFGRLDASSRLTALAVAMALRDACRSYAPDRKQEIGIIGAGSEGALPADLAYFRDYADCGRTLARGSLFIYTLPSSPLGEAAIHFGLAGPLFYASRADAPLASAVLLAEEMLEQGEAEAMLAGMVEGENALYILFARPKQNTSDDDEHVRRIAGKAVPLAELIREFRMLKEQRGPY